jgi:hypothetical protein
MWQSWRYTMMWGRVSMGLNNATVLTAIFSTLNALGGNGRIWVSID